MTQHNSQRPASNSSPASNVLDAIGEMGETVRADLERAVSDALTYLASPRGKELRSRLSMGLIAVAPAIARAPGLRRNPLFRLLGVAGAATVLVKLAEAIRDWEPRDAPAR